MNNFENTRRYDVDWLRVLAFGALIFYHIGMFYVAEWGWHVKSQYQSEPLQYLMLLVNQWRMPLIFFISGFALCMVEPKISSRTLFSIRFFRVLIPLVLGMYLIVPPQAYYEAVSNYQYSGGYWAFWLQYIDPATPILPEMNHGGLGLLTWNHLWYLAYLFCYTLVYLAIKPALTRLGNFIKQHPPSILVLFLLPLILLTTFGLWLKPIYPKTNALFGDWYNHAVYFSVYMFGYFSAKSASNWALFIKHRRLFLIAGLVCYATLMVATKTDLIDWQHFFWSSWFATGLFQTLVYANMLFWMLAVVGYAGAHLNKPSATLSYLNEAILPWYILHQSIMIVLAVHLSGRSLGGTVEPVLLTLGTFAACALCYEGIRRFTPLRLMFGMKLQKT